MPKSTVADQEVQIDRRRGSRREENGASSETTKTFKPTGERRKKQRRRQIDPTTCERDYSNDEVEFMNALDAYKRRAGRMFPTCSEILEVIRDLGYVKADDIADDDSAGCDFEETNTACPNNCDEDARADCVECDLESFLTDDESEVEELA